jgi:RNA-dependent RNA polymerase
MVQADEMMLMFTSGQQGVEFALDLRRRTFNLNFNIHVNARGETRDFGLYRLQIKFDKLSNVFFEDDADCEMLTIPVELPPELYRKATDIQDTHQAGSKLWTEWDAWIRQTDVVVDENLLREKPTGIKRDQAIVDIGKWC